MYRESAAFTACVELYTHRAPVPFVLAVLSPTIPLHHAVAVAADLLLSFHRTLITTRRVPASWLHFLAYCLDERM